MRILFLTKYTWAGPSSRYRTYQYFPLFEAAGISCVASPFFNDTYLNIIYGRKGKIHLIYLLPFYFFRRILMLFSINKYNLIVIEKELIPYFFPIFEKILFILKKKYFLDFDDAIFHNYDKSGSFLIKLLFKNKIPTIIKYAEGICAGNTYLADFAKNFNKKVIEIPTSVDTNKYSVVKKYNSVKFTIGWIGSKSTSIYLENIIDLLIDFAEKNKNIIIKLIGFYSTKNVNILPNIKIIEWNEISEIDELSTFDVGIMPLNNNYFEKGKCGFKLIQYMACSIPTISTPLQANVNIDGGNGNLFASNEYEWYSCLEKIYFQREKYFLIGMKNRKRVEENYSIKNNHLKYLEMYKKIKNEKC